MTRPAPKPVVVRDPVFREWIRAWPCCICEQRTGVPCPCFVAEAAHVQTKRNAGDENNVVPLCRPHHRELHEHGIQTFQRKHRVNLLARARHYWRAYQEDPLKDGFGDTEVILDEQSGDAERGPIS